MWYRIIIAAILLGLLSSFTPSYAAKMLYGLSFQLRKMSSQNVCNLLADILIIQPKTPFCCS
jgi:hypothetical protein